MRAVLLALALTGLAAGVVAPAVSDAATARPLRQATLKPPSSASKARGIALVLRQGGQLGLYLDARRMSGAPARSGHALWFLNRRGKARFMGFIPARVRSGRLRSFSRVSTRLSRPHRMLLTLERAQIPRRPGRIILRGSFRRSR